MDATKIRNFWINRLNSQKLFLQKALRARYRDSTHHNVNAEPYLHCKDTLNLAIKAYTENSSFNTRSMKYQTELKSKTKRLNRRHNSLRNHVDFRSWFLNLNFHKDNYLQVSNRAYFHEFIKNCTFWNYNWEAMAHGIRILDAKTMLRNLIAHDFYSQKSFAGKSSYLSSHFFKSVACINSDNLLFFPSSPESEPYLPQIGSAVLPIQATWYSKIRQKGLHECIIYDGYAERKMLITHLKEKIFEKECGSQVLSFYEAYMVSPKPIGLNTQIDGKPINEQYARYYTLTLRKILMMSERRKGFDQVGTNYAFTYPLLEKDRLPLCQKIFDRYQKYTVLDTLEKITGDERKPFRSMYRGLTPTIFN